MSKPHHTTFLGHADNVEYVASARKSRYGYRPLVVFRVHRNAARFDSTRLLGKNRYERREDAIQHAQRYIQSLQKLKQSS